VRYTRLFVVEQQVKYRCNRAEWYPLMNCISTYKSVAEDMMARVPRNYPTSLGIRYRVQEYRRRASRQQKTD
jgi:hypothetical protein